MKVNSSKLQTYLTTIIYLVSQ